MSCDDENNDDDNEDDVVNHNVDDGDYIQGAGLLNSSYSMQLKANTTLELDSGPSLMVRGGFGGEPEPVHFEDEYEDLNAYRER